MDTPKKILIVDDEKDHREALAEALTDRGYQVFTAADGKEGLDLYNEHRPHLVISDLEMPVMNGQVMLTQIHTQNPNQLMMLSSARELADVREDFTEFFDRIEAEKLSTSQRRTAAYYPKYNFLLVQFLKTVDDLMQEEVKKPGGKLFPKDYTPHAPHLTSGKSS